LSEIGSTFTVTIVTPSGTQEEYNVNHMRAPGSEGDFGVLTGHLPLMTGLRVGAIRLDTDKGQIVWATAGGYVEVLGDQVTILAENAERSDKIDMERAKAARERALGRLSERGSDLDVERAKLALVRAFNRIKIVTQV